jgi:acetyltransferase-like isoleucine patch superfamily enzyme
MMGVMGMVNKINRLAVVETENISKNVTVSEFCVIRKDVTIGDNVFIHPNVVINSGVILRNGVEIFPGAFIGKEPKGPAEALGRPLKYDRSIFIGANCCVGPNAVIYYGTKIGENTLIGDGASVRENSQIGKRCIIGRFVTVNYETIIGDDTKIMDLTHITGKCKIGKNVFMGMLIATANDNDLYSRKYVDEKVAGPAILDGATIGSGATILPGVKIGRYSVVGAQALVSKEVHAYQVVVGVPARFQSWICRCGRKLVFVGGAECHCLCGRTFRRLSELEIEDIGE